MKKTTLELPDYHRVALVLQGGGALGSYQAGVYEGLANAGIHPNWVAGISIGALNCAIIAGNAPKDRVQRLRDFWDTICSPAMFAQSWMPAQTLAQHDLLGSPGVPMASMMGDMGQSMFRSMAAMSALMNGQEGFFKPRFMAPGSGTPDQISFYDTTPLIATLEKFADFDRINSGETRVSLGVTNVETGNFVYFDSKTEKLTPKHFVASGSLPPGFAATEIDGEYYWDGGCVSNTPLEYVLGDPHRRDTLVFQVDVWSSQGALPTDILTVTERQKDIQYSSRTRTVTNAVHMMQRMRKVFYETIERIPAAVKAKDPWFDQMARHMLGARYNVIHLIYKNKRAEGHYKDFQFSAESMRQHWQTGLDDMDETIGYAPCLELPAEGENFVTFDIHTHKRTSSTQFRGAPVSDTKPVAKKATGPRKAPVRQTTARKQVAKKAVTTPSSSRTPPRRAPK
jgi:NTE family protein